MISLMIILNSGCPSNWRSYYPETQYRFAPVFAVSGGETFWYSSNNKKSPFTPTPQDFTVLQGAKCAANVPVFLTFPRYGRVNFKSERCGRTPKCNSTIPLSSREWRTTQGSRHSGAASSISLCCPLLYRKLWRNPPRYRLL